MTYLLEQDPRKTPEELLYALSNEMLKPLCSYYMAVLGDFATLYSEVLTAGGLSKQEILKLIFRLGSQDWLGP